MKMIHFSLGILVASCLPAAAAAQDIFVCSQSDMILTRANDKNNNGTANEPGEYTKAAYSVANKIRAGTEIKATSLFGTPSLLWLDNNNSVKSLILLKDTTADGVYDDSEISTLVGSLHTLFGASASNTFLGGLTEDSAGHVFIANNQFTLTTPASNGILRVSNVTGVPATNIALKTSDVLTVYEDTTNPSAGPVTSTGGSYERIACNKSTDVIYTYHTKDDVVYSLHDIDGDGKFTTPGEVVNFLNLSGHKAGLTRSADFDTSGAYSSRGIDFAGVIPSATNGNYLSILYVEVDPVTGTVVLGTRTQTQSLGTSDISGMILVCNDLNGNGTCNDPGEVKIYVDQLSAGFGTFNYNGLQYLPSASATPGWTGLGVVNVSGQTVIYAMSNAGPTDLSGVFTADIVWKFVDNDFDGLALSAGEQVPVMVQRPAGSVSNEMEVTDLPFTPNFATASNFYVPGMQNPLNVTGICTSTAVTAMRPGIRFYKNAPYLGNNDFQVSVTGVQLGTDFAQLYVSQAPWDAGAVGSFFNALCQAQIYCGASVPNDPANLDEWLQLGVWNSPSPMYLDLFDLFGTGTQWADFTSFSTGDTLNGKCTFNSTTNVAYVGRYDASFNIPNDPLLKGQMFYLQWHVADPTYTPGGGFAVPRSVSDLGLVVLE